MGDRKLGRNTIQVSAGADGLILNKRFEGPQADRARRYANSLAWDRVQTERGLDAGPRVLERDDTEFRLTFPYLDSVRTLQEVIDATDDPADLAGELRACGELLAAVHAIPGDEVAPLLPAPAPADDDAAADGPMGVFHHLTPEHYANASGGELEAWRLFHHDAELREGLQAWSADRSAGDGRTPVHGDLRPDQFLVSAESTALIDWEEFTVGPPTRDLAGVVGALVFSALLRTFSGGAAEPGATPVAVHRSYLERGHGLLDAVGPAVRGFLTAYSEARGVTVDGDRLGADVGWFLLERVLARAAMSYRLLPGERAIAGVGRQAVLTPRSALAILGMDEQA